MLNLSVPEIAELDWDVYERYRQVLSAVAEVNASIAASNSADPRRQRAFIEL